MIKDPRRLMTASKFADLEASCLIVNDFNQSLRFCEQLYEQGDREFGTLFQLFHERLLSKYEFLPDHFNEFSEDPSTMEKVSIVLRDLVFMHILNYIRLYPHVERIRVKSQYDQRFA